MSPGTKLCGDSNLSLNICGAGTSDTLVSSFVSLYSSRNKSGILGFNTICGDGTVFSSVFRSFWSVGYCGESSEWDVLFIFSWMVRVGWPLGVWSRRVTEESGWRRKLSWGVAGATMWVRSWLSVIRIWVFSWLNT